MSKDAHPPFERTESGVSPYSQPAIEKPDYFAIEERNVGSTNVEPTPPQPDIRQPSVEDVKGKGKDIDSMDDASATTRGETASSSGSSAPASRKGSISSVTFRAPYNPSLPQGLKKPHGSSRIREASPPHKRFESHVAFDNIPLGESTPYNPIALTLNHRHAGFQFRRRHRTFMVGVDDNAYSDHALKWLLDELVDDGDEIICVRVIETQNRLSENTYQEDAQTLMESIQTKNTQNHAIRIVLEYAVGKLHNTFQHLIKMYQPSMLIVGTKGRNMDGVQGFLVNRSSFSKYCLQYSPVPVVVVRPNEKREKKKLKRAGDPSRQSYAQMLGGHLHEADTENSSVYELEPNLTTDEEAHHVAMALGLPATYDPTIKPIDPSAFLRESRQRSNAREASALASTAGLPAEKRPQGQDDSGSDSEEEGFEVSTGKDMIKKKLHAMEVNEGAALRAEARKNSTASVESEEDSLTGDGGAKT